MELVSLLVGLFWVWKVIFQCIWTFLTVARGSDFGLGFSNWQRLSVIINLWYIFCSYVWKGFPNIETTIYILCLWALNSASVIMALDEWHVHEYAYMWTYGTPCIQYKSLNGDIFPTLWNLKTYVTIHLLPLMLSYSYYWCSL